MSVGDNEVNTMAEINKMLFNRFLSPIINHIETPAIAIMKVGDSALWLKITIQSKTEDRVRIRKM